MPREPELYKDKVEVALDGRQIFYLFFGGAVIVGLVFVLGVFVGRRVEARSHVDHARTQAATDPLAALDNLESVKPNISFQGTLTGTPATSDVEKKIEQRVKEPKPEKKTDKAEKKPEKKPERKPEAKADTKLEAKLAKPEPEAVSKPEKKIEKKIERKPERPAVEPANPDVITQVDQKPEQKPVTKPDEVKPRFTLQLSSFQDRAEADTFLSSVKAAGYHAYVTEAAVSGKGTFYRVRLGRYGTMEAANEAKADVEKNLKKSASVMRL